MSFQSTLFDIPDVLEELSVVIPPFIKDTDCNVATPVIWGKQCDSIYGNNVPIKPLVHGRRDSKHFEEIYLDHLYPLEEYDKIIVLLSGGKDSIACALHLHELLGDAAESLYANGTVEYWHHNIDGGNAERLMDWRCTENYCKAFAEYMHVPLRISYRVGGFYQELYRIGASEPVEWIDPYTDKVNRCKESANYKKCLEIKRKYGVDADALLKAYGYRYKFPSKSADLRSRWCSPYLKIMVADAVISNLDALDDLVAAGGKRMKFPAKGSTHQGRWCSGALKASVADSVTSNLKETQKDKKILIISGERRGESAGRSVYNEIEIGRTNAEKKCHRIVHTFRPVLNWSEKDVWEIMKRFRIRPHPCYSAGWNRCSCAMCIFSTPSHFAGIREIYPSEYEKLRQDEKILGFTLDNKCCLDDFVGNACSCVYRDPFALRCLTTGAFSVEDIHLQDYEPWKYPVGAFHGAEGGPC